MADRYQEQERFQVFRTYLIEAGKELGVVAKDPLMIRGVLMPVRDEQLTFAEPLEVRKLPSIIVEGEAESTQYAIHIAPAFLRRATDGYLKFAGAHEICHLKLRHLHAKSPGAREELEANGCACSYVGREACIDIHRYLARFFNDRTLLSYTDTQMEDFFTRKYGLTLRP